MRRALGALSLILCIQCLLVAVQYWPRQETRSSHVEAMLPFSTDRISEIRVGDEFDNETVLARVGGRWILPELENLPADNGRVDKLLQAFSASGNGWPVASSVSARQRFRVADYLYRRRVRLLADDQALGTVLLGKSPGFRKVYARNESQNAIYSIAYSANDAPGTAGDWLDRNLLQVRTPLRITADTYSLRREGSDWVSGLGKAPDPRELDALLTILRNLQIEGLASEDAQRDLAEAEADLLLAVEGLAGEVTLELFRQGDRHFVHSSEYPLFFTISAYDYDRLASIDPLRIQGEQADTAHTGAGGPDPAPASQ